MKLKFLALALAAAATLSPLAARADDSEVSFETFYDNLSPYGEWVQVGDYGDCWRPTGVDAEWAPYTDGYWSYTDAGWTWVSYEDFGDICYHYGRWVDTDEIGWCWVPEYEWGPAWVSWRQDDEYIGWAPLPPEATWQPTVGLSVWVDDHYDIGPSYYNFCPVVDFGAPVIRAVCVPRLTVVSIFARTANITNICWNRHQNVVFCGGPNFNVINARLRRPIPTFKLVQNTTIINNNITVINNRRVVKFPRANVAGNTLNVFAPKIVKKNVTNFRPQITKVVQKDRVNRGWKMQDQAQAARLREKVKSEAKGMNPENSPAKPVQVADLKPVPEKANPKGPSPIAGRDRPGKDRDNNDKPDRPVADRPGKGPGADDQPDRPGKGPDSQDKPDRPGKVAGHDDDNKPGRGPGSPVVRPFNEQKDDDQPGRGGGNGPGMAKRQGGAAADNDQAERQQQRQAAEQAERQQRQAELRQRQLEAQRGQAEEGQRRRQMQEAQREQPQRQQQQPDRQEQLQRQAERQQQLQRQAEMQQRQQQVQRQQQMQEFRRQQAQQPQQQPPQVQRGGGGGKQAPVQSQDGGGGNGGRQLTPEQREALRKQRGY